MKEKTLFDDISPKKEVTALDKLKDLDEKIAGAIQKVKTLREEKSVLERRIKELEELLEMKNEELESLRSEKVNIKGQIEDLLSELEAIEPANL